MPTCVQRKESLDGGHSPTRDQYAKLKIEVASHFLSGICREDSTKAPQERGLELRNALAAAESDPLVRDDSVFVQWREFEQTRA